MCQSTFLFRQIKKAELSFYLMKSATSNYALSMILTRRAVLSTQEPTVGTFYVELAIISGTLSGSGAKFTDSVGIGSTSSNITVSNGNDQSVSGTVAVNPVDTRPRNIAFNYIVRAA